MTVTEEFAVPGNPSTSRNPFRMPPLVSITNSSFETEANLLQIPSAKVMVDIPKQGPATAEADSLGGMSVIALQKALCRDPENWMFSDNPEIDATGPAPREIAGLKSQTEIQPKSQVHESPSVSYVQLSQDHGGIAARKWEQRPWAQLTYDSDFDGQPISRDSIRHIVFHLFSGRLSSQNDADDAELPYFEESYHSRLYNSFLRTYERRHLISCPSVIQERHLVTEMALASQGILSSINLLQTWNTCPYRLRSLSASTVRLLSLRPIQTGCSWINLQREKSLECSQLSTPGLVAQSVSEALSLMVYRLQARHHRDIDKICNGSHLYEKTGTALMFALRRQSTPSSAEQLYSIAKGFHRDCNFLSPLNESPLRRSADLLQYVYLGFKEALCISRGIESWCFLFQNACYTYMGFVKQWIFQHILVDPYGEFFIEQALDQHGREAGVRDTASIPEFLSKCYRLIQLAGLQCQIISKLTGVKSIVETLASRAENDDVFRIRLFRHELEAVRAEQKAWYKILQSVQDRVFQSLANDRHDKARALAEKLQAKRAILQSERERREQLLKRNHADRLAFKRQLLNEQKAAIECNEKRRQHEREQSLHEEREALYHSATKELERAMRSAKHSLMQWRMRQGLSLSESLPSTLDISSADKKSDEDGALEPPSSGLIAQTAESITEEQRAPHDGSGSGQPQNRDEGKQAGTDNSPPDHRSVSEEDRSLSALGGAENSPTAPDDKATIARLEDESEIPIPALDGEFNSGLDNGTDNGGILMGMSADFVHFVPIEHIVNTCIREEISLAYGVISSTCVRILREELGLVNIASMLREVLLMHSGNFAQTIIESAFAQTRLNNSFILSEAKVAFCVEVSLKSCFPTLESSFIESFTGKVRDRYKGSKTNSFVNCNRIEALDFVMIGYNMSWPLDLVITKEALNLYSTIASFFLRIKRAATAVSESWVKLREIDRSLEQMSRRTAISREKIQQARDRMKKLFIFRNDLGQLVRAIDAHIAHSVHEVLWRVLVEDWAAAQDITELRSAHERYMVNIASACLLERGQEYLRRMFMATLQRAFDLRSLVHRSEDSIAFIEEATVHPGVDDDSHSYDFDAQIDKVYSQYLKDKEGLLTILPPIIQSCL